MTKVRTAISVALGVSSVALGGYWFGQFRGSKAIERHRSSELVVSAAKVEPDAKLQGTVASLQRRLATLEMRQAFSQAPESAVAAPQPGAAEPEPFDPAKEEEKRLGRAAAVEAAVTLEPRDNAWAPATEGNLRAVVDSAVPESRKFSVKDLKCLTSVCEMVVSVAAPGDVETLTQHLAANVTGMSSLELAPAITTPDGRLSIKCHLFRAGYPRPDEGV